MTRWTVTGYERATDGIGRALPYFWIYIKNEFGESCGLIGENN